MSDIAGLSGDFGKLRIQAVNLIKKIKDNSTFNVQALLVDRELVILDNLPDFVMNSGIIRINHCCFFFYYKYNTIVSYLHIYLRLFFWITFP